MKKPFTSGRLFRAIAASLLLLLFLIHIQALYNRFFAGDEWQHLHMAWLISKGNIPYIDFYEHHTPLLHYLISPLFIWFPEDITVIFAARWFMFAIAIFTSVALYLTVRLYNDRSVALLSVILLNITVGFTRHSLEVRPDVLLMFLEVAAFGCIMRSLILKDLRWMMPAGLLLGLSFLTTPKAVFVCLATATVFLFGLCVRTNVYRKKIWLNILWLFGWFCIPVLFCLLYYSFIHKDGLMLFIQEIIIDNFTLNIQSGGKPMGPWKGLSSSLSHNFFIWFAAAAGMGHAASEWWKSKERKLAGAAPIIMTAMLFLSLFIVPIARTYFFMILYPFLAWQAAIFLIKLDLLIVKRWHKALFLILLISGITFPLATIAGETGYWEDNVAKVRTERKNNERSLWSRILWENTRHLRSNRKQILDLQWVLKNTAPSEPVFDITSLAVMRPDTGWFWGRMYSRNTNMLQSFKDANCRVVIFDKRSFRNQDRLPLSAKRFIKKRYQPVKDYPNIWVSGVNVSSNNYKKVKKMPGSKQVIVDLATTDLYRIETEDAKCRVSGQKSGSILQLDSGINNLMVRKCPSGFKLISESRVRSRRH